MIALIILGLLIVFGIFAGLLSLDDDALWVEDENK
jgi:hypothetical protein